VQELLDSYNDGALQPVETQEAQPQEGTAGVASEQRTQSPATD
jgi:hypothetical protein